MDSPEVLAASPMSLTDKNLFAYCDNNPVTRADQNGELWNFVIGGIVGGIVGGVVAALNGENVVIGALTGMASGLVAASGWGLMAQAAASAGISAAADVANQTVDIIEAGGNIRDYNVCKTITEAGLGFVTSVAGSLAGDYIGKHITKTTIRSNQLYDKYLEKTFTAGLRKEIGRSSSTLQRQANRYLRDSNFYLNISRGVSSVAGSVISLWNIVR